VNSASSSLVYIGSGRFQLVPNYWWVAAVVATLPDIVEVLIVVPLFYHLATLYVSLIERYKLPKQSKKKGRKG
jgi:hypothetical protein